MARPRKSVWESADRSVYIKPHRGGYLVVDTRGEGREVLRRSLADAVAIADALVASTPKVQELTFFELAARYFTEALPVWSKSRGVALTANTVEDRKGRVRTYWADFGDTPLSELPVDIVARVRAHIDGVRPGASLSLVQKIVRDGVNVLEYGREIGLFPADRAFPVPKLRLREEKVDRSNYTGRERRVVPSHRVLHRLARIAARRSGADYMRLFFWLLAYIGFREGELCALTVDDVVDDGRLRIEVTKKVVWRPGAGTVVENYAKNYSHRTVVVPRILEAAVQARVNEVRQAGGTLMFPRWNRRGGSDETHIDYSGLKELFVAAGAEAGMKVLTSSTARRIKGSDGRWRNYAARPQSLEFSIHDLRAHAATVMTEHRAGIALRGMGMSKAAAAKQLGDTVETIERVYLGVFEGNAAILDREVP